MLDVNCELWRVKAGERIVLTLASSLDGEVDDGTYKPSAEANLDDVRRKRISHSEKSLQENPLLLENFWQ
jgi:hypothetical protein